MKNIRAKLMLAFGVVLVLSFILSVWSIFSVQKMSEYQELDNQLKNIQIALLKIERAEKTFIAEDVYSDEFYTGKESPSMYLVKDESEKINEILLQIIENPLSENFQITNICRNLQNYFIDYNKEFEEMSDLYFELGYRDFGLEGEMRKVIHTVENSEFGYDISLLLNLRRHEKDFLLRKEVNFVTRFNQGVEALKSNVENVQTRSNVDEQIKNNIIQNIYLYQENFLDLVSLSQKIGLTKKEGVRGELQSTLLKIEPVLEDMYLNVKAGIKYKKRQTIVLLIIIFIVQLIVAVTFALLYSKSLTRKIVEIKNAVVSLSTGNFPEPMVVSTKDELGESTQALNVLMDRIKTAIRFSSEIGKGNLDYIYDEKYKEDVFARSLISMKEKLREIEKENFKSRWTNEGLAVFTEILHSSQENLELFAERIITELSKFIEANQCALYINDDDNDKTMSVMAVYAWGKKKYVNSIINFGEGLVGQAWQEGKTIYLTEIPQDYIKITSGLGKVNPSSILIVPLIHNDIVFGMIELASFKNYESYEINFVEKLGENIASTVSGVLMNKKTKELLEKSQIQAEEMRAQEEELRQNAEELQATQEEMERQQRELKAKLMELQGDK